MKPIPENASIRLKCLIILYSYLHMHEIIMHNIYKLIQDIEKQITFLLSKFNKNKSETKSAQKSSD